MSTNVNKRELLRKKREAEKRRKVFIFLGIAAGVVLIFVLASILPKIILQQTKYAGSEGFTVGSPDAPITVVQFSSYTCSFCKAFSENVEKQFIKDYVETGEVYYRFVNIASNTPASELASKASYCAADQNRFYEFKDLLYTYASSADAFSRDRLIGYANSVGMDTDAFGSCLDADTYTNAYLEDRAFAESVGLTGTPSFLVNDQLVLSSELIPTVDSLLGQ